jgi:inner membrane protein
MMFVTHLSFALFLGLMIFRYTDLPVNLAVFLILLLLGSLAPDIDSPTSFMGRKTKPVSWFFKHRGPIHSFLAMMVFTAILLLITPNFYYALAFVLGYLSHLLMDSVTPTGIPFFWPSKKRMRGKIRTAGLIDVLILFVLIAIDIFLFLMI